MRLHVRTYHRQLTLSRTGNIIALGSKTLTFQPVCALVAWTF